jgi:hypothetical protein
MERFLTNFKQKCPMKSLCMTYVVHPVIAVLHIIITARSSIMTVTLSRKWKFGFTNPNQILEFILIYSRTSGPSGQCTFSGHSGQHFSTSIPLRSFVFIPLETYFLVVTKIERLKWKFGFTNANQILEFILIYSRTSLARTRRDCQNLFELSVVRATEVP